MKLKVFYGTLITSLLVTSFAVGKLQSNHREIMIHRDRYRAASKVRESFLQMQTNFRGDALFGTPEFKKAQIKYYGVTITTLNSLSTLGKEDKKLVSDVKQARDYVNQWQALSLKTYAKKKSFSNNTEYVRYLAALRPATKGLRDSLESSTSNIREKQRLETQKLVDSTNQYNMYLTLLVILGSFSSLTAAFSVGKSYKKLEQELNVAKSVLSDRIQYGNP